MKSFSTLAGVLVFALFTLSMSAASEVADSNNHNNTELGKSGRHGNESEGHSGGVTLAGLNFEEVKTPLIISIVIILAAVGKLGFHSLHFLSTIIPESCLLIVIGVILGAILHFSGAADHLPDFFAPHEFFLYLLPPIILEASFSLHDRSFYNNIGGILLFAVVGTVIACFTVGYTLFGLAKGGALGHVEIELTATEVLIFAALIVAVDPVAVLAVFDEVGVNSVLYFVVFGESLLNDGVTVVIYRVMQELNEMETVTGGQIVLGFVAFFIVAGGGLLVGVILGVLCALVTKHTNSVRVVEPIAVFGFAYLAYILAELFEFSGIISMIGCGLVQMQYTFHNITDKSRTTIKYFIKVISTTNEIIIFLFLGLALVRPDHDFHVGFVLWTVLLTLLYRFIITYGLSFLLNRFDRYRVRKISVEEQFIISYGGLRGAVCFSLVAMLNEDQVPHKRMFVTTTLAVVIFTVFVQGITIKPLVKLLHITLAPKDEPTLYQELNSQVSDHLMAGVEDIIGFHGKYHFKEVLEHYDDKYLKKFLQRNPGVADGDILRLYSKLALRDHVENLYACGAAKIPNSPAIAKALPISDLETELFHRLSGYTGSSHSRPSFSIRSSVEFEPVQMRSIKSQRSQSFREPSMMMLADEEKAENLINKRNTTGAGDVEIEIDSSRLRRRFRGRKDNEIRTYKDLRKHLVKNPSRMFMHMKYDPDLSKEDKTDLLQHLQEKHMRNRRLQEHAVSVRPGLERCMSWACAKDDKRSLDEADARLRHYKAMSVDFENLAAQTGERRPNRLLGGATAHTGTLPQINERSNGQVEDRRDSSSERKRSMFHRADATSEEDETNENIGMDRLDEQK